MVKIARPATPARAGACHYPIIVICRLRIAFNFVAGRQRKVHPAHATCRVGKAKRAHVVTRPGMPHAWARREERAFAHPTVLSSADRALSAHPVAPAP